MLLITSEHIPGKDYEVLGLVKGNMVQTKNIARDFGQGLKSMVGGELKTYTDMMNEARSIATERMCNEATALGADAIVMVRYASSAIAAGAAEVIAYGTAVKYV